MINMKIARLMHDGNETYGLIRDGNVATKDSMVDQTGIPLPFTITDFLFEGWYDEIKDKISPTSFHDKLEKFSLLNPLPSPSKIICLTFNYPKHAKEQNYVSTKDPVIFKFCSEANIKKAVDKADRRIVREKKASEKEAEKESEKEEEKENQNIEG